MKTIKVYGPGCRRCDATQAMIEKQAAALGVAVSVEKVTDVAEILGAGVMSTPGVSVDGKLVHAGGLPDAAAVAGWLKG